MNSATIIERAKESEVILSLTPTGKIKAAGDQDKVDQLIPIISANKAGLIKFLQQPPVAPELAKQTLTPISEPRETGSTPIPKVRISKTALSWLQDHRQELRAAGWTPAELYRRNKSKGIAWLRIWNRSGLTVILAQDGSIVFRYVNEIGNPIKQTAFPRKRS